MTMSEVTPAEWRKHFLVGGLALLGLPALTSSPLVGPHRALAEQHTAIGDANTAAIAGGAVAAKLPVTYSIRVIKQSPDKLKLRGLVIAKEDHKALLGLVKASFPSAEVSDRIKVADGPKAEMKLGGISFALKALSYLQTGSARIEEQGVALNGSVENRAVYDEVKTLIESGRPTGLVVTNGITQPRNASAWRVEISDGKVRLTGAVPDADDKKELEATVQKLFSGTEIVDNTYIANEPCPETWLDAAMHSLKVLRLLSSGVVQLADHSIRLDGHASDEATLRKIDDLADRYPAGFALESQVSVATAQASVFSFGAFPLSATAAAHRRPAVDGIDIIDGSDTTVSTGTVSAQ
jgi:hypothetical protein